MAKMDKPFLPRIELLPARRLAWLLGAVHLGALLLLAALPMVWWAALVLAALLVASALQSISRHALRRGPRAVTAMELADREQIRTRRGDGSWQGGRLLGTSTIGAILAVLNIHVEGQGVQHVVISSDGIDGDDFRRLRVWLRWGPRPTGADDELP